MPYSADKRRLAYVYRSGQAKLSKENKPDAIALYQNSV